MKQTEILTNLCSYDTRNPISHDLAACQSIPQPRQDDCYCDNCHYGRDELAVEVLRLMDLLTE